MILLLLGLLILGGVYYLNIGNEEEKPKKTVAKKTVSKKPKKKESKKSLPKEVHLAAVGDILLGRKVSDMINAGGPDTPFAYVSPLLKEEELVIGNLESPLSSRGTMLQGKDVTFRGNPQGIVGLKNSGIDVITLANNHALDCGAEALQDTISLLDQYKIYHAGAGLNIDEAKRPARFNIGNKKISFLGYSYIMPSGFQPTETKPGIAPARPDINSLLTQIKTEKKQSDFVFIYFHWGAEYQDYALDYQRDLARKCIDAGADLVLGSHPHVIQGIEVYKKKLIAYSLGDFVFDHYSQKTGEAFILKIYLNQEGTLSAEAIPVYLTSNGQPRIVTGEVAARILGRLKQISSSFGTQIRIEQDKGIVEIVSQ